MEVVNEYEGKVVLVTGGAGCIGTNNISFVNGSILDDEMLKRVFKEKPDYVFHLAAHFANQNSVDNPAEVKNHEISQD
jgi:nucleoside-diphosphate-sugar epimerase